MLWRIALGRVPNTVQTMLKRLVLLVLLCSPAAHAQLWSKTKVEVKPGVGIGPILLGKPLKDVSADFLGKATAQQPAGSNIGSGYALFGKGDSRDVHKGILVRLNDGKAPENVFSVQARGLRAVTALGVYLGGPASLISKRYPEAQVDTNSFTRQPEYCLPGLTIRTMKGKVDEFLVEPPEVTRWRFTELQVVPGKKVGPFEIGKAVPDSALELLGPPSVNIRPGKTPNSGLMRWSIPGQDPQRMIEVILHNGHSARAVVTVRVRGVNALTDQRVRLGDPAQVVKDYYPDGREGVGGDSGGSSWRVPGANFSLSGGRLKEMLIYAVPKPGRMR